MHPSRVVGAVVIAIVIWIIGLVCVPSAARGQSAAPAPSVGLLPSTIPIFPLHDVVLFPHITRPIHIFEPRYRAMVVDALKGDRIIGMVLLQPGHEADYEGRPPVFPIGCAGEITEVEELPDGRFLIQLRGLVKFRVNSEDQSRAYRLATVEAIPETPNEEEQAALVQRRKRLVALVAALVPGSEPPPATIPDEDLVNGLAQYMSIDPVDRQELLERKGPLQRSEALIELLEKAAPSEKIAP